MHIVRRVGGPERSAVGLRARLLATDVAAAAVAVVATQALSLRFDAPNDNIPYPLALLGWIAATIGVAHVQQLYRTSRCSVRSAELAGIVRTGATLALVSLAVDEVSRTDARLIHAALLGATTVVALSVVRGVFRSWLRVRRSEGHFLRRVVVVGADEDAARLVKVLHDHVDYGFCVVGMCADRHGPWPFDIPVPWQGGADRAAELVADGTVSGAIVVGSALDNETLNRVVRSVSSAGGHVHLSSGLKGLASQRIESVPMVHEPLLHIQPQTLDPRQTFLKRSLDVTLSAVLLTATAPLVAVAALAVRLTTPGPALFRQVRVGRDGRPFELLKLRTMHEDAELLDDDLLAGNMRQGPLFKLENDPRVTPVGRWLRAMSIDELPQLWNVLRGEMSLVGPRPALPSEVEQFPEDLVERTKVPPGVTGLWQVEARDNPSFDAYARLDLFYVENWTLTFDLVILVATVESELMRLATRMLRSRRASSQIEDLAPWTPPEIEAPTAPPIRAARVS